MNRIGGKERGRGGWGGDVAGAGGGGVEQLIDRTKEHSEAYHYV